MWLGLDWVRNSRPPAKYFPKLLECSLLTPSNDTESGGKGNNESTWQTENKGGKEPSYFWDLVPEGRQYSLSKSHPFCVFTNTKFFSNSLGKKISWLPLLVSDCPTFKESTSLHSHFSPSHLVQLCGYGELNSLLLGPPHGWGSIPISCLFFDRTMLSSPFPGPNFQVSPLPLTSNTVEKVLSLLIELHLPPSPHFLFSHPIYGRRPGSKAQRETCTYPG